MADLWTETPELWIYESDALEPPLFAQPPNTGYALWPECRANGRVCHDHCACERVPVQLPRDTRMIATRGYLDMTAGRTQIEHDDQDDDPHIPISRG